MPVPTPQRLFVDDSVYVEIYKDDKLRIEKTVAAGIEAIFILLGDLDLSKWQDPISFDKMEAMMLSHLNKILGKLIHTHRIDVGVPESYIHKTVGLLRPFHKQQKSFTVKEMEKITGMLVFIANTVPWVKFLLSHMYTSIAAAIGNNTAYLHRTNKQFRAMLKDSHDKTLSSQESTFAQSKSASAVHASPCTHWINKTMREELYILLSALESPQISVRTPIGHLVRRGPSTIAWSDSCLYAAGGFSIIMKFWWYIK
jgi:hypothetical protein